MSNVIKAFAVLPTLVVYLTVACIKNMLSRRTTPMEILQVIERACLGVVMKSALCEYVLQCSWYFITVAGGSWCRQSHCKLSQLMISMYNSDKDLVQRGSYKNKRTYKWGKRKLMKIEISDFGSFKLLATTWISLCTKF